MNVMNVPIEVMEDFTPPDVQITFYLNKMMTEKQEGELKQLIGAWFAVGLHRGYGEGVLHYLGDVVFDDEQTIYVLADMGSCSKNALDVLLKIVIDALQQYNVTVNKITLE